MASNRERYKQLLDTHGITQVYSATLIEAVTKRPCSPRTVRAWLNDPAKSSSRQCPSWAVSALEQAIRYMQLAVERRQADNSERQTSNA